MENESIQNAYRIAEDLVLNYGLKVIGAIIILIVGRIAAGLISRGVRKTMTRARVDPALTGFMGKLAYFAVFAFAFVAALEAFGVKTTSFIAVLGAAGLAIGLALQGSLSNFASGVMILLFRPFKIGDYVSAGGVTGTVVEISVFTTIFHTPDNQRIIVPNGAVMGGNITNVTALDTRRVDLVASIGYGDDIDKAKQLFLSLCQNHPLVHAEPEPVVKVMELADSSVNLMVRPWCNTSDYWDVYFDLTEQIKKSCDEHGLNIPFPQQDVHLYQNQ